MKKLNSPALRESLTGRNVLDRIFELPQLEKLVPQLRAELIHRVIQNCGLEDCGELVMLATPQQLARIFDVDLWKSSVPGKDEQFDADRFGLWLEVLAESDVSLAAQKISAMDADLVSAGIVQHARVFDIGCMTPYRTTDGEELVHFQASDNEITADVGGYRLVQKRSDSWDAIVAVLIALDAEYSDSFHRIMRGCRAVSNGGAEVDELDELLVAAEQTVFDLSVQRERRRNRLGYATPADARAFLIASRSFQPDAAQGAASFNPVAHPLNELPSVDAPASSAFAAILLDAGIQPPQPRALLGEPQSNSPLKRIRTQMLFLSERDEATYSKRSDELTYLANVLMVGCPVRGRAFTPEEATEAAIAVCNLALEHLPSLSDDFLINHDLLRVFQSGWRRLYKDVAMFTAERLLEVVTGLKCDDPYVQDGLAELRVELSKHFQSGTPWQAREALDVLMILDTPAWAALLDCIAEFPVLHRANSIPFDFISEKSHIKHIHDFVQSLPQTLAG